MRRIIYDNKEKIKSLIGHATAKGRLARDNALIIFIKYPSLIDVA